MDANQQRGKLEATIHACKQELANMDKPNIQESLGALDGGYASQPEMQKAAIQGMSGIGQATPVNRDYYLNALNELEQGLLRKLTAISKAKELVRGSADWHLEIARKLEQLWQQLQ